jgi:hypothetical protein
MILGAVFGLLLSCALAFVLEYLDLTIRTAEDAERRLGLPVLAVVPVIGSGLTPGRDLLHPIRLEAVPEVISGA